jgi:hypothetical protein
VAATATVVAGGLGVFFTWLTSSQGRAQVERLSQQAEDAAERSRLLNEKRNAYLAVLYYSQLEMRRAKYEREGEHRKLREVEDKWPKGERVRLYTEAVIAVEAFGSKRMREIIKAWREAEMGSFEDRMSGFYNEFLEQTRREIAEENSR